MLNDINKEKFDKELKPIFEKFKFSSNEPFIIPSFKKKEDYEAFFYTVFHASVYKTISHIQDYDLNLEEYYDIYKRYISKETMNGQTIIFYQKQAIIKITPYTNKDGSKTEAIYPLHTDLINFDKNDLKNIKNEKADIKKIEEDFNNQSEIDIDFDDF